MGSSSSPPPAPTLPNPVQLNYAGAADNQAYGALVQLQNNSVDAQSVVQNILTNPYASDYQYAANNSGQYYASLSGQQSTASNNLYASANAALPYAQPLLQSADAALPYASQILQTGFDPQNALYNRTEQTLTDQTLAGLAATGTASTPYGASVLGGTLSNFNIDWQNNLLSREATAAGGYGTLMSGIDNTYNTYDSFMSGIEGQYTQAGQEGMAAAKSSFLAGAVPYQAANDIYNTDMSAINAGSGIANMWATAADQYLGLGTQNYTAVSNALNQNYQDQLQKYQAEQANSGQLAQGVGELAGIAAMVLL